MTSFIHSLCLTKTQKYSINTVLKTEKQQVLQRLQKSHLQSWNLRMSFLIEKNK